MVEHIAGMNLQTRKKQTFRGGVDLRIGWGLVFSGSEGNIRG